uniref:Kinesin-3 n=1 Tax=Lygus hesperus TaxID=30085 RepID=A0A0A9WBH5_LYGHE
MHDIIQDMKGNIRVFVRIRPYVPNDNEQHTYETFLISPDDHTITVYTDTKTMHYNFDRIFSHLSTQNDIFEEVEQFIQSALDGYHICLFSYGQTGSGKTYTMTGSDVHGRDAGIVPRSISKILQTSQEMKAQGWDFSISVSFIECYNNKLFDLLSDDTNGITMSQIQHQPTKMLVPGLTVVTVNNEREIFSLMEIAVTKRSTAQTMMNDHSSRSHFVFTMYIQSHNSQKSVTYDGCVHLCDLAGSERTERSQVVGERQKETNFINTSLTSLGRVFSLLAKKSTHIPYRDSILTWYLQHAFTKNGKTAMIVNLSPTIASSQESLSSLRFAMEASQVHLG